MWITLVFHVLTMLKKKYSKKYVSLLKLRLLVAKYAVGKKTIIFTQTKKDADSLASSKEMS